MKLKRTALTGIATALFCLAVYMLLNDPGKDSAVNPHTNDSVTEQPDHHYSQTTKHIRPRDKKSPRNRESENRRNLEAHLLDLSISNDLVKTSQLARNELPITEFVNFLKIMFARHFSDLKDEDIVSIIEEEIPREFQEDLFADLIAVASGAPERLDRLADIATNENIRIKMKQRSIIERSKKPKNYPEIIEKISKTDNSQVRLLYLTSAISSISKSPPDMTEDLEVWLDFLDDESALATYSEDFRKQIFEIQSNIE